MSDAELDAYNRWLNSGQVVNAMGDDRAIAGDSLNYVIEQLEQQ